MLKLSLLKSICRRFGESVEGKVKAINLHDEVSEEGMNDLIDLDSKFVNA